MRWLWIDEVISFDRGREILTARAVRATDAPLPHHFPSAHAGQAIPIMPASLIIEGCAQSGGILIGEALGFAERVILAKISRAEFELDAPAPCDLRYRTTLAQMGDTGASTESEVSRRLPGETEWTRAGRVSLMFSMLDRANPLATRGTSAVVFGKVFYEMLQRAGVHIAPFDPSRPR